MDIATLTYLSLVTVIFPFSSSVIAHFEVRARVKNVFSLDTEFNLTSNPRRNLLMNSTEYFPNYVHIWDEYYGQIPAHFSCPYFAANKTEALKEYASNGRVNIIREPDLSKECGDIRRRVRGNAPFKPIEHPYAIARNVYKDYYFEEALLAFSYSPDNFYCYVMDKKSDPMFKRDMRNLAECLPNVLVLKKMYSFDSAGHYQDDAHFDCTEALLKTHDFEYVMYLQNADVVVKTPEEISQIIGVLNGSALTQRVSPNPERVPQTSWKPIYLKLVKNESDFTLSQLHFEIKVWKSPNHVMLPRSFVEAVHEKLNLTSVLNLFSKIDYGMDEMLYITLLSAHSLELPCQIENDCPYIEDLFRFSHWNYGADSMCQSGRSRHNVCLLGMEYVPTLLNRPHIIANKVWPEFDFGMLMCLGEILYNRSYVEQHRTLNLRPYGNVAMVREHHLKSQGRFNVSSFDCDPL